jgi:basic amino acid/polyamine antiporter, APA family
VTELQRRLGVPGAIVVGLSAMIGAGVFFVWAPAAASAGSWLPLALVLAAVVATANALSTTQLAMAHPVSGGAYTYGRRELGPRVGFSAGVLFLTGKTASVSAIALIAGQYLLPAQPRLLAVAAIVVLAVVNISGIRSTAAVSAVVVTVVLVGFAVVLGSALPGAQLAATDATAFEPLGILRAAAILFFSFAGYARIATLGEEVREPRRTLPRAVVSSLGITLLVYTAIGSACLLVLGPAALASSSSPVADLFVEGGSNGGTAGGGMDVAIRVIAGVACLGSLLGILAGLSRTGLAMAREHDLPGHVAFVWPRTGTPVVAEVTFALIGVSAVLLLDPTTLIGFSSCAVLGYYAVANTAALRQSGDARWLPRWVSIVGLVGCLALALSLPWVAIAVTFAVLGVAHLVRVLTLKP